MRVVGVCGYGFTGSGAVLDLLKEYHEFKYVNSSREIEFTIPYEYSGLYNLELYLTKNPVKHLSGDYAISNFKKLAAWQSRSMNRITNGKFSKLTDEYIDSLIQVKYMCARSGASKDWIQRFYIKAASFVEGHLERRFKRCIPLRKEEVRYISVYPEDFLVKTKKYINDILDAAGLIDGEHDILLDQPFPPNNPEMVFHYYDAPYAIVISRDPRDLYVLSKHLYFSDARFIPHDSVKDFVRYYKAVTQHEPDLDKSRVLRISFEDLIYEYDDTVNKIEKFLHISKHANRGKFLDPNRSIRNTQMMDLFEEDREAIKYIEQELADYLFPFEKYPKVTNRDGIYGPLTANQ